MDITVKVVWVSLTMLDCQKSKVQIFFQVLFDAGTQICNVIFPLKELIYKNITYKC